MVGDAVRIARPGRLGGDLEDRGRIDDQVRIGIPEDVILRGSVLVYMLPLLTTLCGAGFASTLSASEAYTVLGAALGFAGGFALVRLHAWRHRDDTRMQPVLLEILSPGAAAAELQLR